MATLTVRNLDDDVKQRLRTRAAEHGRSMEAEAREILRETLMGTEPSEQPTGQRIRALFAGLLDEELPVSRRDEPPRAASFSE